MTGGSVTTRRAGLAVLVATGLALAACGVLGPQTLEVPPGYHVVIGRMDLQRAGWAEALVELTRDDGAVGLEVPVRGASDFLIMLPPGRYEVRRVRAAESGRTVPDHFVRYLRVAFEVPDAPAVYVGTLRVIGDWAPGFQVEVQDEYDRSVSAARHRYPALPEPVRSLFRPT